VAKRNEALDHAPARRAPAAPARPAAVRVPELDRVIHERIRLAVISALAVNDALTFTELKGTSCARRDSPGASPEPSTASPAPAAARSRST